MHSDRLTTEINLKPVDLRFPLHEFNGQLHLPLLFLADFYDITVTYRAETGTVVIDSRDATAFLAELAGDTCLREGPGLRFPYLDKLTAGETVRVEQPEHSWCLVRTDQGYVGYVPGRLLQIRGPYPTPHPPAGLEDAVERPALQPPLVLVWEDTYFSNPDVKTIAPMPSVNIVSPTWFHLIDSEGNLRNLADPGYVKWAKEQGYQVWALASNSSNPEITAAVLSRSSTRKNMINQLLIFARLYGLDGINIDFENFHCENRDLFTQLIRELFPLCREEGLYLSVDVTMVSGDPYWSLGYDRAALAEAADYLALMAYDEHWENAPVSGPVASLLWVEQGLQRILEEVPAEKLLLGVPFYTRLWRIENRGGSGESITSRSYSMTRIDEILAGREVEKQWDEQAGQFMVTYTDNGDQYRAWIEDASSMSRRLRLVGRYNLAGVAAWRRGLEKPEIWDLFQSELKESSSP